MKEHIISTQDEYDRVIGHIALLRKRPFYDIECNMKFSAEHRKPERKRQPDDPSWER
jgi:hypothetical protein